MRIELIFTDSNNSVLSIDTVKEMMEGIFEINDATILIDGENADLEYSTPNNNNYVQLKISMYKDTSKEAVMLSRIKQVIMNGKHRKNFNIIVSYDESSNYYCGKLFVWLSAFERKLRKFIYITIVELFGNEWFIKTVTENLQDDIKSKLGSNSRSLIEKGLQEFSFNDYTYYLFHKKADLPEEEVIKQSIDYLYDENFSKNKMQKILEQGRKVSLWEKFFGDSLLYNFDSLIEEIRKIRNIVMHNKEVMESDFLSWKKLLLKSIRDLDTAIDYIEHGNYRDVDISDIIVALNDMLKKHSGLNEMTKTMQQIIGNIKIPVDSLLAMSNYRDALTNVNLGLSQTTNILTQPEIVKSLARIQNSFHQSGLSESLRLQSNIANYVEKNISFPNLSNIESFKRISEQYQQSIAPLVQITDSIRLPMEQIARQQKLLTPYLDSIHNIISQINIPDYFILDEVDGNDDGR